MIFRVYVKFKDGILDPEAEAIKQTIANMGSKSIKNIEKGKFFDIEVDSMQNFCYLHGFRFGECFAPLPPQCGGCHK